MQENIKNEQVCITTFSKDEDDNSIIECSLNDFNDPNLLDVFKDIIINGADIYKKQVINNEIILERVDNSRVEIINLRSKFLNELLDEKVSESYKNIFKNLNKNNYGSIYFTTGTNKSEMVKINSPINKNLKTLLVQLTEDGNGNLKPLDKEVFDFIIDSELINWFDTFFQVKKPSYLSIVYDSKIMIVKNNLIKYLEGKQDLMENSYMKKLDGKTRN